MTTANLTMKRETLKDISTLIAYLKQEREYAPSMSLEEAEALASQIAERKRQKLIEKRSKK